MQSRPAELKSQTTIRHLLLAMAMIAAGLACIQTVYFTSQLHYNRIPLISSILETEVLIWLAGGPLIGAGLMLPLKRACIGAAIGFACQFIFTVVLLLA